MRRYLRTLILIVVLVSISALVLSFENFSVGDFERGVAGSPLGIELGLDLRGGSELRYQANLSDTETVPSSDQMKSLKRSIERRISASGFGEPIIQILGEDRLLVQLPGISDLTRAKEIIGETAQLVYLHRTVNVSASIPQLSQEDIQLVSLVSLDENGQLFLTSSTTTTSTSETSGASATSTSIELEQVTTTPAIRVDFTDACAAPATRRGRGVDRGIEGPRP